MPAVMSNTDLNNTSTIRVLLNTPTKPCYFAAVVNLILPVQPIGPFGIDTKKKSQLRLDALRYDSGGKKKKK